VKRETRLNLLFLVGFLILSLPGAVILFKKKLDPSAPPLYRPDPIRHQIAYMAPVPDIAETRRVVPPGIHRWIAGLIALRAPGATAILPIGRQGTFSPAISDDRRFEVVAYERTTAATTVYLLTWESAEAGARIDVQLPDSAGGKPLVGETLKVENLSVPKELLRELRDYAFASPPTVVQWVTATFPERFPDSASVALKARLTSSESDPGHVNFFTNSGG
jgi:hypothetical protein